MRGQSRFTVVSLGIYIHVSPFYFSIGLQMQKGERLLGEREFTLVGCFRYRPLPTDCFLDLDAKYLPSFRAVEWKMSFKSATILLNLFNFSSFFFYFSYYNFFVFFYSYAFFHVHSKSYLRGI